MVNVRLSELTVLDSNSTLQELHMEWREHIWIDAGRMHGVPCMRGTRVPVYVILDMLSKTDLLELHASCDCFVLFHRAEGWGLPHFEASMMGKPVITTGYSANMEFTRPEHSYLAGYKQIPITGMEWFPWYTPNMTWADPDVDDCRRLMQHVFRNQGEARRKGKLAKAFVQSRFTWPVVGAQMKKRLDDIYATLA